MSEIFFQGNSEALAPVLLGLKTLHREVDVSPPAGEGAARYVYLCSAVQQCHRSSRVWLGISLVAKTMFTLLFALRDSSVREDWSYLFHGKRVVRLYGDPSVLAATLKNDDTSATEQHWKSNRLLAHGILHQVQALYSGDSADFQSTLDCYQALAPIEVAVPQDAVIKEKATRRMIELIAYVQDRRLPLSKTLSVDAAQIARYSERHPAMRQAQACRDYLASIAAEPSQSRGPEYFLNQMPPPPLSPRPNHPPVYRPRQLSLDREPVGPVIDRAKELDQLLQQASVDPKDNVTQEEQTSTQARRKLVSIAINELEKSKTWPNKLDRDLIFKYAASIANSAIDRYYYALLHLRSGMHEDTTWWLKAAVRSALPADYSTKWFMHAYFMLGEAFQYGIGVSPSGLEASFCYWVAVQRSDAPDPWLLAFLQSCVEQRNPRPWECKDPAMAFSEGLVALCAQEAYSTPKEKEYYQTVLASAYEEPTTPGMRRTMSEALAELYKPDNRPSLDRKLCGLIDIEMIYAMCLRGTEVYNPRSAQFNYYLGLFHFYGIGRPRDLYIAGECFRENHSPWGHYGNALIYFEDKDLAGTLKELKMLIGRAGAEQVPPSLLIDARLLIVEVYSKQLQALLDRKNTQVSQARGDIQATPQEVLGYIAEHLNKLAEQQRLSGLQQEKLTSLTQHVMDQRSRALHSND